MYSVAFRDWAVYDYRWIDLDGMYLKINNSIDKLEVWDVGGLHDILDITEGGEFFATFSEIEGDWKREMFATKTDNIIELVQIETFSYAGEEDEIFSIIVNYEYDDGEGVYLFRDARYTYFNRFWIKEILIDIELMADGVFTMTHNDTELEWFRVESMDGRYEVLGDFIVMYETEMYEGEEFEEAYAFVGVFSGSDIIACDRYASHVFVLGKQGGSGLGEEAIELLDIVGEYVAEVEESGYTLSISLQIEEMGSFSVDVQGEGRVSGEGMVEITGGLIVLRWDDEESFIGTIVDGTFVGVSALFAREVTVFEKVV